MRVGIGGRYPPPAASLRSRGDLPLKGGGEAPSHRLFSPPPLRGRSAKPQASRVGGAAPVTNRGTAIGFGETQRTPVTAPGFGWGRGPLLTACRPDRASWAFRARPSP